MSRWLLVVVFGFVCVPVRAADVKPLWEIDTAFTKSLFHSVDWLSFSPDGKLLVSRVAVEAVDGERRVVVWEVGTRKERTQTRLRLNRSGTVGLRAAAITKDGTVLLPDESLKEMYLADGKVISHPLPVNGVGQTAWFNAEAGSVVWLIRHPAVKAFDPYGFALAIGKRPALLNDPKTPEMERKFVTARLKPPSDEYEIRALAVSPDATRVAMATYFDTVANGEFVIDHKLTLYTIAIADTLKLTEVVTVPSSHKGNITFLLFSPDGKTLATGSGDSSVALWEVSKAGKDWKPRALIPTGQYTTSALAFSPDARTLAAGTFDEKGRPNLYLIDVVGGKLLASSRLEHAVTALAYSSDGKILVTGDSRGRIKAWNAEALRNP